MADVGNALDNSANGFIDSIDNVFSYGDVDVSGEKITKQPKKKTIIKTADGEIDISALSGISDDMDESATDSRSPQSDNRKTNHKKKVQRVDRAITNTEDDPKMDAKPFFEDTMEVHPGERLPSRSDMEYNEAEKYLFAPKQREMNDPNKIRLDEESIDQISAITTKNLKEVVRALFEVGMKEICDEIKVTSDKVDAISSSVTVIQEKNHSDAMLLKDLIKKAQTPEDSEESPIKEMSAKIYELSNKLTTITALLTEVSEKQKKMELSVEDMIAAGGTSKPEENVIDASEKERLEKSVEEMENMYKAEHEKYEKSKITIEKLAGKVNERDTTISALKNEVERLKTAQNRIQATSPTTDRPTPQQRPTNRENVPQNSNIPLPSEPQRVAQQRGNGTSQSRYASDQRYPRSVPHNSNSNGFYMDPRGGIPPQKTSIDDAMSIYEASAGRNKQEYDMDDVGGEAEEFKYAPPHMAHPVEEKKKFLGLF